MDNHNNICPSCGASNEANFSFCRMCGTPLAGRTQGQPYTANHSGCYEPNTIGGHPTPVVRAFVGANGSSQKIIRRFADMEMSRSSVSWCWPVFLLSFLLGPMYSAVWFFYRRMNKTGLLVALIGTLISLVEMGISFEFTVAFTRELLSQLQNITDDIIAGNTPAVYDWMDNFYSLPIESSQVNMLTDVVSLIALAGCAVLSVFALKIYKNHISKKLNCGVALNDTYEVSRLGGTSTGGAVLSVILLVVTENIIVAIPFIYAVATSALPLTI